MKPLFTVLILTLFIFSCQKKKANKNPTLEIGNAAYADVTERNFVVSSNGFGNTATGELDLNDDGQMDIRFRSTLSGSANLGEFDAYSIESINGDCFFSGTFANDTTWIQYDTTYLDNQTTGETIVIWQETRACTQVDPSFTLINVEANVHTSTLFLA